MSEFLSNLFSYDNFSSIGSPGWLWCTVLIFLKVSYDAGAGKLNPLKTEFKISSEVNKKLNLDYWQISTFSIAVYILQALFDGISVKGVSILFSAITTYISIFGLRSLRKAKKKIENNDIDEKIFISKFDSENIDISIALERLTKLIKTTYYRLYFLLVISIGIIILSHFILIEWIWTLSFTFVFLSFICQSIIILIDKLISDINMAKTSG